MKGDIVKIKEGIEATIEEIDGWKVIQDLSLREEHSLSRDKAVMNRKVMD